jgi:hypothetical protein
MAVSRIFLFLLISSFACLGLGHSMPGRKEDGHYTEDGKHNDEYDHETFLGHDGQQEFGEMENEERVHRLR